MAAVPAWLAAVEALLDRSLQGSAQGAALTKRLEGAALGIEVAGLTNLRASVHAGRLLLDTAHDPTNATISGSPFALLQLARGGAFRGASPSRSTAQVRGDAEIANLFRELFALARPDLEEELSRFIGDLPARSVARFAHGTLAWARRARRTAGENIAEYLQEESRDLVNRWELEEFLRGVDRLRETADRIEIRMRHLEDRLKGAT